LFGPDDPVSRYLFDKRHFSPQNKRVKQGAFLPDSNLETSVFFIKELVEEAVWDLGENYAAQGRTLRGRAQIPVQAVEKAKLALLLAEPPPRHGVIVKWPQDKDLQKALALELAENAELRLRI
jgi:hypothetical protein